MTKAQHLIITQRVLRVADTDVYSEAMLHSMARSAIDATLDGVLFDARAVCLAQVAKLNETGVFADQLIDLAFDRARGLPATTPSSPAPEFLTQPLVDGVGPVAEQLGRLIVNHPHAVSAQLVRLHALSLMWPHASRDERYRLRRMWHHALHASTAPDDSILTRKQLCNMQRNLPTQHECFPPRLSDLAAIVRQPDSEIAYQTLAVHLGPQTDLKRLGWVLGALSGQLVLQRFDKHGLCLRAQLGTVAWCCLQPGMGADTAVILISQLAHEIWWLAHRAGLKKLRPGSSGFAADLVGAIHDHDSTAAQRAARQLACHPARFWQEIGTVLTDMITTDNPEWPRAINAVSATLCRTNGHPLAADDAAILSAALVAASYHAHCQGTSRH